MMWILLTITQLAFLPFVATSRIARSRRLLAGVLIFVIPLAGPLLALIVARARGGKMVLHSEHEEALLARERAAEMRRAGDLTASLERLMSANPEERLAALVKLSGSADARAVAQLRWAVEHGSREVVLDAALTLEELDLRREKRLEGALHALETAPCFQHAFAAAEASAHGVLAGLADDASIPALADQARELYLRALLMDPVHANQVEERLARLELAVARPDAALEILTRLTERQPAGGAIAQRLRQLRDQAAFGARRFDLLSFRSLPLHPRATLF